MLHFQQRYYTGPLIIEKVLGCHDSDDCCFVYIREDFRVQYKQKHPNNKSVAIVGKAGGEKWKSLSDADKAPYVQKAEKRKVEYEKNMTAYNKKLAGGPEEEPEEESDKSKSEVNDEDDDDGWVR
ncbi:high mobility group B protein 3-like [Silene latifolia]|uniref:high mobility group B protein 3-like n=1 Tax=Silene latifolia TaxID=37657 RepID=UPI003D77E724